MFPPPFIRIPPKSSSRVKPIYLIFSNPIPQILIDFLLFKVPLTLLWGNSVYNSISSAERYMLFLEFGLQLKFKTFPKKAISSKRG